MKFPKLYKFDGGVGIPDAWVFGWLTGKDNDLVCIKPNLKNSIAAEIALSPVCSSKLLAFSAAILKLILIRIDHNARLSERSTVTIPTKYLAVGD